MSSQISPDAFSQFFAWAPIVIGIAIYAIFFVAKRHESGPHGAPVGQSYACAQCGRRSSREHMLPQERGGSVNWYCERCAREAVPAH